MPKDFFVPNTTVTNPHEPQTSRTKRIAELFNSEPKTPTMSVGQAPIVPDVLAPEVAAIRYITVIVAILVLSLVAGWRLGWSLGVVLLVFSILSMASVGVLTLIETKQIQGVLNATLDYFLNAKKVDHDAQARKTLIENAAFLDFYELRHRTTMERQKFIIDNQLSLLAMADGDRSASLKNLISDTSRDAEPGVFIDTMLEDQLAVALTGFLVSLFDVDSSGRWTKMDSDGALLIDVPWDENGTMSESDRAIAMKIFDTISSRNAPLVERKEDSWLLNLTVYDRPIEILKAFDTVYQ